MIIYTLLFFYASDDVCRLQPFCQYMYSSNCDGVLCSVYISSYTQHLLLSRAKLCIIFSIKHKESQSIIVKWAAVYKKQKIIGSIQRKKKPEVYKAKMWSVVILCIKFQCNNFVLLLNLSSFLGKLSRTLAVKPEVVRPWSIMVFLLDKSLCGLRRLTGYMF